ncbi:unnamed protein product [Allacma fusca]|uniref:Uncharacterized protein n=1 Tax=Allacma fusca TaxID=39272 RepID=A0A8J2LUX9_9HEXA|nr:unnamed protein product [Allacma fusca]
MPIFVLVPKFVEKGHQDFAGYLICWYSENCRSNFRCSSPDCFHRLSDYVNKYGKWACYDVQDETCVRVCLSYDASFIYGRTPYQNAYLSKSQAKHIFPNQFKCIGRNSIIETLVEGNLTEPRTALVVLADDLEYYWGLIGQNMKGKDHKFAHNRRAGSDDFLRQSISLIIPYTFTDKYDYVGKRARVMMSSGLYWLWEKWDRIRFPKKILESRRSFQEKSVKPMNMKSSIVLCEVCRKDFRTLKNVKNQVYSAHEKRRPPRKKKKIRALH